MKNFKSILITGANRGIGLEFVKQFANLPAKPDHIIATVRQTSNTKELREFALQHSNISIIMLSVTDYASYSRIFDKVHDIVKSSGLDLLINNAGIAIQNNLENTTAEDMIKCYEVNTIAPLLLSKALLPLLKLSAEKKFTPVIANISSKLGSIGDNTSGSKYAYRCSKTALNMATKSLSVDLKNEGIMCVSIHPGAVLTDMNPNNALITCDVSIAGMIKVLTSLNEEMNGKMINYNGEVLPF